MIGSAGCSRLLQCPDRRDLLAVVHLAASHLACAAPVAEPFGRCRVLGCSALCLSRGLLFGRLGVGCSRPLVNDRSRGKGRVCAAAFWQALLCIELLRLFPLGLVDGFLLLGRCLLLCSLGRCRCLLPLGRRCRIVFTAVLLVLVAGAYRIALLAKLSRGALELGIDSVDLLVRLKMCATQSCA